MQKIHKSLLCDQLNDKRERTEVLLQERESHKKLSMDQHILMRDKIMETFYEGKKAMRPVELEMHMQEY